MSYNPNQAKDATRAQSLAVAFRDNTAGKSLTEIGKDKANSAAIKAFQDSAGLVADGIVGNKTLEAYGYYLGKPFTPATATKAQASAQKAGVFVPHPVDKVPVNVVQGPVQMAPAPRVAVAAVVTKGTPAAVVKKEASPALAGFFGNLSPAEKIGITAAAGFGLYEVFGKGKKK